MTIATLRDRMARVLTPRERKIIEMYYLHLHLEQGHTLKALASQWGISPERIGQIRDVAIEKMRLKDPELPGALWENVRDTWQGRTPLWVEE